MIKKMFSAPFLAFILCGTIVPLGVIAYYGLTDRSGAFTWANVMAMVSGDHAKVARWRRKQSLLRTRERRPDMYEKLDLSSKQDKKLLKEMAEEDAATE